MLFPQAVLEQDPAYVVRRFESGKYAVDSDVRSVYLEVNVCMCVRVCTCVCPVCVNAYAPFYKFNNCLLFCCCRLWIC